MMKPFFMLPGEPFDFCRDHFNFKVSMEVGVPNVPGRVNDDPEYFVLKRRTSVEPDCSLLRLTSQDVVRSQENSAVLSVFSNYVPRTRMKPFHTKSLP
jgi:hypothetical protein